MAAQNNNNNIPDNRHLYNPDIANLPNAPSHNLVAGFNPPPSGFYKLFRKKLSKTDFKQLILVDPNRAFLRAECQRVYGVFHNDEYPVDVQLHIPGVQKVVQLNKPTSGHGDFYLIWKPAIKEAGPGVFDVDQWVNAWFTSAGVNELLHIFIEPGQPPNQQQGQKQGQQGK